MKVVFLKKFSKDLDKCPTKVKKRLATILVQLENTASLDDMRNCKPLKGHNNAYRIRLGDYRLGLLWQDDVCYVARFVHRKDIYRLFP